MFHSFLGRSLTVRIIPSSSRDVNYRMYLSITSAYISLQCGCFDGAWLKFFAYDGKLGERKATYPKSASSLSPLASCSNFFAWPNEFLPRAEENGLIVPINEWVLREACHEAKSWQQIGEAPLRISVNLSPIQFRKQSVPLLVTKILGEIGLQPGLLDLELT